MRGDHVRDRLVGHGQSNSGVLAARHVPSAFLDEFTQPGPGLGATLFQAGNQFRKLTDDFAVVTWHPVTARRVWWRAWNRGPMRSYRTESRPLPALHAIRATDCLPPLASSCRRGAVKFESLRRKGSSASGSRATASDRDYEAISY